MSVMSATAPGRPKSHINSCTISVVNRVIRKTWGSILSISSSGRSAICSGTSSKISSIFDSISSAMFAACCSKMDSIPPEETGAGCSLRSPRDFFFFRSSNDGPAASPGASPSCTKRLSATRRRFERSVASRSKSTSIPSSPI